MDKFDDWVIAGADEEMSEKMFGMKPLLVWRRIFFLKTATKLLNKYEFETS